MRVVLAVLAFTIYLLYRTEYSLPALAIIAMYAVYGAVIAFRTPVESAVYPAPLLFLDLGFYVLVSLHSSAQAVWLGTVCYFYLISVAALLYTWRNVLTVMLVCVSFFMVKPPEPLQWGAILLGGAVATLLAIQREAYQEKLTAALKRSVMSRLEAEAARELERQRIGADFHDGPLQSFISFQMRLEIIRKLLQKDTDAAQKELVQLQELGKSQVTELRAFIRNMQPVEVDEAGLAASIREVTNTFQRDTGISVRLDATGLMDLDNQELAMEVLQIVREALNNVRKHSKASEVAISVATIDDYIEIHVQDDGSGFPFAGTFTLDELDAARLGPKSIRRRIRTLNGELRVESRPSEGAILDMRIPA